MPTQVLVLNIGLNGVPFTPGTTNGRPNPIIASKVFACSRALRKFGFVILNNKVVQSDTEPTWAVEVAYDPLRPAGYTGVYGAIRGVAATLKQEVIAGWDEKHQSGFMKGATTDLDDAWGDFDPALFFLPTGERLAATLPAPYVADRQQPLDAYAASRRAV